MNLLFTIEKNQKRLLMKKLIVLFYKYLEPYTKEYEGEYSEIEVLDASN